MLRLLISMLFLFEIGFSVASDSYIEPSDSQINDATLSVDKIIEKAKVVEENIKKEPLYSNIENARKINPEDADGFGGGLNIDPFFSNGDGQSNYFNSALEGSKKINIKDLVMQGTKRPYVLISFSMSDLAISKLIDEAVSIRGVVALNGFYQNDLEKTLIKIKSLAKNNVSTVKIDPTLFKRFNVDVVPTFIMPKTDFAVCNKGVGCPPPDHFKLSGVSSFRYFFDYVSRMSEDKEEIEISEKYLRGEF